MQLLYIAGARANFTNNCSPQIYLVNLSEKDYARKKNKWLMKIKQWVDTNDSGSLLIPFSGSFELNVSFACFATSQLLNLKRELLFGQIFCQRLSSFVCSLPVSVLICGQRMMMRHFFRSSQLLE